MIEFEELNANQKKLNLLLGLEKETFADMVHQQSKIIEKLQAAKAQAAPQWISVKDQLPKHDAGKWSDPVIALSDIGLVFRLSYCGGWERTGDFMSTGSSKVTHWIPMPKFTEDENEC